MKPASIPTKFPHRVESLTAWRGVIYKTTTTQKVNDGADKKTKTYDYFKLVYCPSDGGRRKTKGFDSIAATMKGVAALLDELRENQGGKVVLSNAEGAIYEQAMESMAELPGVPLNIAVADYVAIRKLLGPVPPVEAARFYGDNRGLNLPAKTVTEVVDELIKAKHAEKLCDRHITDLKNRLGRFKKDFQCQIADVNGPLLSAWLRGLGLSARSENNFRTGIQNLMTFAKSCGYLPRHWDELERVQRVKDKKGEVKIFTPDEISRLLTTAGDPYEMGNSPAMIKEHYHRLVKPKQAKRWFVIGPGSVANVVDMPRAATAANRVALAVAAP